MRSTHSLTKVTSLLADDVFSFDLDPNRVGVAETPRGIKSSDMATSFGGGVCPTAYGAKINGTFDDTASWERAMASGYPVACSKSGTSNIEGGFTITEDQIVTLNPALTLERQGGGSTDSMIHCYGDKWVFDPRGATIREDLYECPNGIIRIGPSQGEVEGGPTDVTCRGWHIASSFKLLGPWNNNGQDGTVGLYIDSARRLGFSTSNPNYGGRISAGEIYNCDFNAVMATDVNRHHIELELYQFGTAALVMNASYGNHLYLRIETPQPITPEAWRKAIHFGTQNYLSTESGTSDYDLITAAWRNKLIVYGELAGSGTRKCRLIMPNEPGTTVNEGYNDVFAIGQFGGGIGSDGTTSESGIGTNWCPTSVGMAEWGRPWKIHGWEFRRLDDDSGHIQIKDSTGKIGGRKSSMEENYRYDLFSIDNVGSTQASVTVELDFDGKTQTSQPQVGGKYKFLCPVTASTARQPLEIARDVGNRNGEYFFVQVVESAGTNTNTGKFTVSVCTKDNGGAPDNGQFSWDAKITSSNSEGADNLDWSNDISILSSSTSGAVSDDKWRSKVKIKTADETITTDTTLSTDAELEGWDVDNDTTYIFEGVLIAESGATEDMQWRFLPSQTPQDYHIGFEAEATQYHQTSLTAVQNTGKSTKSHWKLSGFLTTNATTGGSLNFQWAQITSGGTNTTVFKGSWMKLTRLDSLEFQ